MCTAVSVSIHLLMDIYIVSLAFFCKAVLVVLTSLSFFFLSIKFLVSLSNLNEILDG